MNLDRRNWPLQLLVAQLGTCLVLPLEFMFLVCLARTANAFVQAVWKSSKRAFERNLWLVYCTTLEL